MYKQNVDGKFKLSVGLLIVTLARLWIKSPIESTEKHHGNDGDCRYAGDSPYAVIAIDQRVAKVGNLDLHHGKGGSLVW